MTLYNWSIPSIEDFLERQNVNLNKLGHLWQKNICLVS